jgi:hypothetical protein
MSDNLPTGVLVITTLPGLPTLAARVVSTQDVRAGSDIVVIVSSLAELIREVEAWWFVYWRPDERGPEPTSQPP